ncbi:MAG: UPF0164 family protein [Treponema sp.]|nr:UPF0164 family protein [Treponema sp.]
MRTGAAVFLTVLLVFFPLFSVHAEFSDDYGNVTDYLHLIYGIDNNAGLTVFPILNIPIGGGAESMAGAFSAISNDVSFIDFNPAGSSMLERTELAFFHNNWIADTKIEGAAYAARFGNFGFAAGMKWLYMPFTEYNIYGERVSNGYYSEGVATLNASYNFFSGYYFSGVSVGINVKGAFRLMPDYTDDFSNILGGSGLSQSAASVMADIGFLTRFNMLKAFNSREKNASAAIVMRNFGLPALDEPLPSSVSAAFSWRPIRPVTIALDFTLPVNLMDISLSEMPYAALGISANITRFLSMRAGFLYKAGSSRISVGSAVQLNNISVDINYTLDLLTQLQPLNRVSLGVRFDMGDRGRRELSSRVDELYLLGLEAFSHGNWADARLCWNEALRLNPRYEPALESLAMLNDREELIQNVDELYRLDF